MEAQLLAANYHKNLYRILYYTASFTRILRVFTDEEVTEKLQPIIEPERQTVTFW